MENVAKILKPNGLFLLDCDNIFRLIQYLNKHPKSPYKFDFVNMKLKEKGRSGKGVRYYNPLELKILFNKYKLKIISIYGNYEKNSLDINSKRIIIIGKKC